MEADMRKGLNKDLSWGDRKKITRNGPMARLKPFDYRTCNKYSVIGCFP